MQLNEIIRRFQSTKPNGKDSYQARCPCHDDKTASLTVSEVNGKILMHCHAGCDIHSICAAIGIAQRDLFTDTPTAAGGHATGGSPAQKQNKPLKEVCRYVYTDESGVPLHATIRYEPKSFRQVALNPNGSIREWTLKNTRTVLYNLPDIIEAQTVYLVEGEKDVNNLKMLKLTATTSPMGAGKWRTDYTEMLRGKDVVIIPDNDAAGQKHAGIVSCALYNIANSVKVAQLVGISAKGDVSDYISQAKSLEEARAMILALPLAENMNIPETNQDTKFKISDYSDIGVADAFTKYYGNTARFSSALGWLVWDGKRWENNLLKAQGLEVHFTEIIRQHALKSGDSDYIKFATKIRGYSRVQGVLGIAKSHLEIDYQDLDTNPCDLNTPAGIVDLKTGQIRPHDPAAFCTKQTAVSPSAERSEIFDKFLHDITLGNEELAKYVQCVAGMACLGKVYSEVLIIAHGGGHNGKSTLWNTLYEILGDYSGKIPAEALTTKAKNPKNDLAELFGKRLVIASETEEGNRLSTAMLKQVSSTDPLSAEKKFRDPFVFTPTHSLILYTNYLPKIGSDDLGTWRRLVPVPFMAKIENPQLDLAERLLTEAGGAILQWCIEGAMLFIANGYRLPDCRAVNSAKEQYKADNDWLTQFLEECCEYGASKVEKGSLLYAKYVDWCLATGEYKRCNRDFAHALEARGVPKKRGNRGVFWYGLAINDAPE
jgi:P4 family phage/plasmid primase-like protien